MVTICSFKMRPFLFRQIKLVFYFGALDMNSLKFFLVFNSLPKGKIVDNFKLKAFAEDTINVIEKNDICFGNGRKHFGKRRKCWYQHLFSLFPQCFRKSSTIVIKSPDYIVKKGEYNSKNVLLFPQCFVPFSIQDLCFE